MPLIRPICKSILVWDILSKGGDTTEINFNKLNFKPPREAVIYEVAHVMGMMKREQEIQQ